MVAEAPLSAVFVTDISPITAPMLSAWVEKGHRVAAVVVSGPRPGKHASFGTWRKRLRRRLLLARSVGQRQPPVIEFTRPYDWEALGRQLDAFEADVLICFGLHALIPPAVLARFPRGGLNLHPALLPNYRGPHPMHRLVIDRAEAAYGGVTLHKMTEGFDEGDILAQISFDRADWHSAATTSRALADAMAMLVASAAPEHCRGTLRGVPQPRGNYTWAQLERKPLVVGGSWSSEHVARLCRVIGFSIAVNVSVDGKLVRLAQPVRRIGPAIGKAPVHRWGAVIFDCADTRVVHLGYNGLSRQLMRWQRKLSQIGQGRRSFEIRRFGSEQ